MGIRSIVSLVVLCATAVAALTPARNPADDFVRLNAGAPQLWESNLPGKTSPEFVDPLPGTTLAVAVSEGATNVTVLDLQTGDAVGTFIAFPGIRCTIRYTLPLSATDIFFGASNVMGTYRVNHVTGSATLLWNIVVQNIAGSDGNMTTDLFDYAPGSSDGLPEYVAFRLTVSATNSAYMQLVKPELGTTLSFTSVTNGTLTFACAGSSLGPSPTHFCVAFVPTQSSLLFIRPPVSNGTILVSGVTISSLAALNADTARISLPYEPFLNTSTEFQSIPIAVTSVYHAVWLSIDAKTFSLTKNATFERFDPSEPLLGVLATPAPVTLGSDFVRVVGPRAELVLVDDGSVNVSSTIDLLKKTIPDVDVNTTLDVTGMAFVGVARGSPTLLVKASRPENFEDKNGTRFYPTAIAIPLIRSLRRPVFLTRSGSLAASSAPRYEFSANGPTWTSALLHSDHCSGYPAPTVTLDGRDFLPLCGSQQIGGLLPLQYSIAVLLPVAGEGMGRPYQTFIITLSQERVNSAVRLPQWVPELNGFVTHSSSKVAAFNPFVRAAAANSFRGPRVGGVINGGLLTAASPNGVRVIANGITVGNNQDNCYGTTEYSVALGNSPLANDTTVKALEQWVNVTVDGTGNLQDPSASVAATSTFTDITTGRTRIATLYQISGGSSGDQHQATLIVREADDVATTVFRYDSREALSNLLVIGGGRALAVWGNTPSIVQFSGSFDKNLVPSSTGAPKELKFLFKKQPSLVISAATANVEGTAVFVGIGSLVAAVKSYSMDKLWDFDLNQTSFPINPQDTQVSSITAGGMYKHQKTIGVCFTGAGFAILNAANGTMVNFVPMTNPCDLVMVRNGTFFVVALFAGANDTSSRKIMRVDPSNVFLSGYITLPDFDGVGLEGTITGDGVAVLYSITGANLLMVVVDVLSGRLHWWTGDGQHEFLAGIEGALHFLLPGDGRIAYLEALIGMNSVELGINVFNGNVVFRVPGLQVNYLDVLRTPTAAGSSCVSLLVDAGTSDGVAVYPCIPVARPVAPRWVDPSEAPFAPTGTTPVTWPPVTTTTTTAPNAPPPEGSNGNRGMVVGIVVGCAAAAAIGVVGIALVRRRVSRSSDSTYQQLGDQPRTMHGGPNQDQQQYSTMKA